MGRDSDTDESSDEEQHYVQRGGKWVPLAVRQNKFNEKKEQYYVQRGGKWVPLDTSKQHDEHEYFVQRNGKWVKMDMNSSLRNSIVNSISKEIQGSAYSSSSPQQIVTTVQNPQQSVIPGAQQQPDYIIYVTPPAPAAAAAPAPQPVMQPPISRRAVPNEYSNRPVAQLPAPQRRQPVPSRPPPRIIDRTPPPTRCVERRAVVTGDAYERGREAFLREKMEQVDLEDSPGYYLAGYIHYQYPEQQTASSQQQSVSTVTTGAAAPMQMGGGLQIGYANQFPTNAQQFDVTAAAPVQVGGGFQVDYANQFPTNAQQVDQPASKICLPVFQEEPDNFIPVQPSVEVAQLPAASSYGYQQGPAAVAYQTSPQPSQARLDGLPVFDDPVDFQPIQQPIRAGQPAASSYGYKQGPAAVAYQTSLQPSQARLDGLPVFDDPVDFQPIQQPIRAGQEGVPAVIGKQRWF